GLGRLGTSRWKDSNTPGKKVPKKVLRYFPIIPKLPRLSKSSHIANEMIRHATGKCTEPGKMQNTVDGRAWKKFNTNQTYNMWPVILMTYNLPPWLCMKESSFMLTLLIPGPKSPGQKFNMRAMVLKKPHKWKSSREFNGQTNNRDPPKEFGRDEILDTAKARQDLQSLGIQSGLWLGQSKNGKCLKPQAAYSLTPENQKKFCQFIKGVKLPDGFGSCFKHKVTDNDTNIMGLKSYDCRIMMQRLLPYGLQNYLPDKIAKPIIELCSLFKQICSATLMEDDMLKAQIKVVDILCDLELIYPPALFDIMIHLALEGGPIHPRWMYPFERYMKKLKGYVRNKAKPEGSIAEGYVAEEALTFKLNNVKWYVLHNSPEINTYRSQFKSLFPNKDMKEEFPEWFGSQIRQRHVDNDKDPEVSTTNELFALACGLTWTPISINSCTVDGVRYVVHSRDERRITQNSGICSPGPDGEMYYEDDPDIIHFDNSSDLPLSTSLNDLDNATLHIDGQSTEVDVPPNIIIDVVDEDDDITDDEDTL
nr:hypothetical protein [Tanacetum cinerariifolium]